MALGATEVQLRLARAKDGPVIGCWIEPLSRPHSGELPSTSRLRDSVDPHRHRSLIEEHLVHVTPEPPLIRLVRLDNWVVSGEEMLERVLVRRLIAASDIATGQADAQIGPRVPHLEALLAAVGTWRNLPDVVQVRAVPVHRLPRHYLRSEPLAGKLRANSFQVRRCV